MLGKPLDANHLGRSQSPCLRVAASVLSAWLSRETLKSAARLRGQSGCGRQSSFGRPESSQGGVVRGAQGSAPEGSPVASSLASGGADHSQRPAGS
eukprot:1181778-Prorocentrum_minimum.AAC.3